MKYTPRAVSLLILFALTAVGCSVIGAGNGRDDLSVRVENNLLPPTTLSVYAIPEVGSRIFAGVARPGETATLSFSGRTAESYRFAGETTAGREILSTPITLAPGETAVWDVNANIVIREDPG